ncbi:amidohydrolase [Sphingopyxis indica]|uniref:amidohydrolase n=1 Tax=Sphingopyxis indica TaxID=436663 RepID=UPI002938D9CD|nr:amidohydrolase [Sphingopyxis indica]WOF42986.1 amidohydrolase [Sphingopyxis indica]
MRRSLLPSGFSLTAIALVALSSSANAATCDGSKDVLLLHGKVLTVDKNNSVAQAIAIRHNRIIAVGTDHEIMALRCEGARIVDLHGRTVIPGLTDAHIHAIRGGQSFDFEEHWNDIPTLADALRSLSDEAAKRPANQWLLVGGGWHPDQFKEGRAPTSDELTKAVPDHPAMVEFQYDWAVLNRKGIEALALAGPSPTLPAGVTVERDAAGRPTGMLRGGIGPFSNLLAQLASISREDRKASLVKFLARLGQYGVTGVVDAAGGGSGEEVYDPVIQLWQENRLPVRVAYRVSAQTPQNEPAWYRQTLAYMPPAFGDDKLHFAGLGEIVVFGMNDATRLTPGFTPSAEAEDRFYEIARWAAARGYMLEIHAYTDDAANHILDVLERVAKAHPIDKLRWDIAHISTGTPETFARMKALGLAYNIQQNLYFEAPQLKDDPSTATTVRFDPPTKLALDAGLIVAGGTDATRVSPYNTMLAIEFQIDGRAIAGAAQRDANLAISREQALRMYTINSAWLVRDDDKRGSLEVGKLADLAVLDKDYLTVPVREIGSIRSVLTMMDGKVTYAAGPYAALSVPDRSSD